MKLSALATAIFGSGDYTESNVLSIDEGVQQQFLEFLSTHGKSYGTQEEFNYRLQVFADNLETINAHNESNADDATLGLNHMADWTSHEFKRLLGFRGKAEKEYEPVDIDVSALPDSVDWRSKGAVTPVKNQGQCGSCWAFSTTGAMEGRYQIKTGDLESFSEQQFVDCSKPEGNMGCQGGLMDMAFTYAEKNMIETESQYPYTGRNGQCHSEGGLTEVTGFTDVPVKSPSALMAAVAEGPVSVAIAAGRLQFYMGGIVKHLCGTRLDHGVLLVGYGTEKGTDYWLVKNSWGPMWGEKGYFKLLRDDKEGKPGMCGIQLSASYPEF